MVLWAFPFMSSNFNVVASPTTVDPADFPELIPERLS